MEHTRDIGFGRSLGFGVLAGAAGTAAMDLVWFVRYRRGGGADPLWRWESAQTVKTWDDAPAPGQLGRKLAEFVVRHPPPDRWARSTTNAMHWATGAGWGVQYGLVVGKSSRHRWLFGLTLGPVAWLTSYVVLPLAKVYKPIWDYDAKTLAKDLSAHMAYGAVTGAAFAVLARAIPD
jgi:hypothetical protein